MYTSEAQIRGFPSGSAGCSFADVPLRSTMFVINKVLNQAPRQTSNLSSHSTKKSYKRRSKKCGEKKGGGKGNFPSYLTANKWCKNVTFRAFHDVDDNKGSYTSPSTMLMKTIEKQASATKVKIVSSKTKTSKFQGRFSTGCSGGLRPPRSVEFENRRS